MRPFLVGVVGHETVPVVVMFATSRRAAYRAFIKDAPFFRGDAIFVIPLPRGSRYIVKRRQRAWTPLSKPLKKPRTRRPEPETIPEIIKDALQRAARRRRR